MKCEAECKSLLGIQLTTVYRLCDNLERQIEVMSALGDRLLGEVPEEAMSCIEEQDSIIGGTVGYVRANLERLEALQNRLVAVLARLQEL